MLELKVPSSASLGVGGTDRADHRIGHDDRQRARASRVGLGFIIPAALAFAVILLFLGRLALAAQRRPPVTGDEALIGTAGRSARRRSRPTRRDYVRRARRDLARDERRRRSRRGRRSRVLGVDGLTLDVEPLTASTRARRSHCMEGLIDFTGADPRRRRRVLPAHARSRSSPSTSAA